MQHVFEPPGLTLGELLLALFNCSNLALRWLLGRGQSAHGADLTADRLADYFGSREVLLSARAIELRQFFRRQGGGDGLFRMFGHGAFLRGHSFSIPQLALKRE